MKKIMILAAAMLAAVGAQAQEVSDVEFGKVSQQVKYNYLTEIETKRNFQDEIKSYPGNATEPVIWYSSDVNGGYIPVFVTGGMFARNWFYGAGAGYGHDYRGFGWEAVGIGQVGTPDRHSDDTRKFLQGCAKLSAYLKVKQWRNHHDYLAIVINGSVHLSKFLDRDKVSTSYQDESGTTILNTKEDLNVRELTSGVSGGLRFNTREAFGSLGGFAELTFGVQQNIKLNSNVIEPEIRLTVGVEFRVNRHCRYNTRAMQEYGYSEQDVWNMRKDMMPYQTK